MINIEKVEILGWEAAIRGMRNPRNSWDRSDTVFTPLLKIGEKDLELMKRLSMSGSDHAKFMRFINVTADINAPIYWWKEYDTYKVGTVANSSSTMNKIHEKELTIDDFSTEHLCGRSFIALMDLLEVINKERENYVYSKDKDCWWQIIQLIPSSYNQRRTVQLNYMVLKNMYHARKTHRLDEWRTFCEWIEKLPYGKELIYGE